MTVNRTHTDEVAHRRLLADDINYIYQRLPYYSDETTTTSVTSHDYTDIPNWVNKITIIFAGLSTNGAQNYLIQIGDSGGFELTGYLGAGSVSTVSTIATANYTTGFGINVTLAAMSVHGSITLTRQDIESFTWVCSGAMGASNSARIFTTAGMKVLSSELTQLRITTLTGVNVFDAGSTRLYFE